jgi:hypothetical protein
VYNVDDKKNYPIEILYDNGEIETYQSGAVTEIEFERIKDNVRHLFQFGSSGKLELRRMDGPLTIISFKKVSRISFFD